MSESRSRQADVDRLTAGLVKAQAQSLQPGPSPSEATAGGPLDRRRAPLDDARWMRFSDPERDWCITLPQPWAELTLRGVRWAEDRRGPPPPELIGKIIHLHASAGIMALKHVDEAGREDAERILGSGFRDLTHDLPRGQMIGRVRLTGAFRIGGLQAGRVVRARMRGSAGHLGDWRAYDGNVLHRWGDHSSPRWLWVLEAVDRSGAGEALKAYAGVFDLITARVLQTGARVPVTRPASDGIDLPPDSGAT